LERFDSAEIREKPMWLWCICGRCNPRKSPVTYQWQPV